MLDGADTALGLLLNWQSVALLIAGVAVGTVAAILPGISALTMMALLIPLTFGMGRYDALMTMSALMAAGGFAGSMTSILLNIPGDGMNAATCLDGYPMARQGKAGVAIGASATASGLGALFGLGILIATIPVLRNAILLFGPPEFFALTLGALSLIAAVSPRAVLRGLISGMLGMALGLVGINYVHGGLRYTFGIVELIDGIPLAPAVIGLFALPELYLLLRTDQSISETGYTVKGDIRQGIVAVLKRPVLFFRSAAIGTVIGAIPGVGGGIAAWTSYYVAATSSRDPDSFGKGNVEGVIAPEAAIDAKEGGSLMPLLALGLPGSASGAILLAAFQIHGVTPGQRLFQEDMALVWVMILAMVFSNVTTSVLGLAFAAPMVKMTLIPSIFIAPVVLILAALGSYGDSVSLFGLVVMLAFGFLGVVMGRLGYPRAPILLGLILLPLTEQNFHLSLQIYRGSYEFLLRPMTFATLAIALLALVIPQVRSAMRRRRPAQRSATVAVAARAGSGATLEPVVESSAAGTPGLSDMAFLFALLGVAAVMFWESLKMTSLVAAAPRLLLVPLVVILLAQLVQTFLGWRAAAERRRPAPEPRAVGERTGWWITGWIIACPALMWLIGILPAAGVYPAAFLLAFSPQALSVGRVVAAVITGLAILTITYFSFVVWMGIYLHRGILVP